MDEETARWVRVEAARNDTSVSRWIGDLVRRQREREEAYEVAHQAIRQTRPRPLKKRGGYPSRDDLHERARRYLLTEDLQAGQDLGGILVLDPSEPEDILESRDAPN